MHCPDQQGIIVVGDIDVDKIEQKIKSVFSSIEMPANAATREYFPVSDNDEPIVAIAKDKEQVVPIIYLFHKHDAFPNDQKSNMSYLVVNYMKYMIASMLNARLSELTQQANPPFLQAQAYDGEFLVAKTKGAFIGLAVAKEDGVLTSTEALMKEIERVRQFGFTASEYARAKADYLRMLEVAYNERDKQKTSTYVQEYVRHFIDNEPIPGIENEYAIMNQIVPNIPVEAVNEFMKQLIKENNIVLCAFCPEKEGMKYPTEAELKGVIDKVRAEKAGTVCRQSIRRTAYERETAGWQGGEDRSGTVRIDCPDLEQRRARHREADRLQGRRNPHERIQPGRKLPVQRQRRASVQPAERYRISGRPRQLQQR